VTARWLAAGDLKPGDTFVQPDGDRETRRVTAVTWTGQDDVTGGGAVEIASVAVAGPDQRTQCEVFAAADTLSVDRQES
jgi:hypothetical protein